MTKYNKLVRDKIPEIIKKDGCIPLTHLANHEEYWIKLKEKLEEETQEFLKEDNINELVDILEVIYAIKDFKFKDKNLEEKRKNKEILRGKFTKRIILDEIKNN